MRPDVIRRFEGWVNSQEGNEERRNAVFTQRLLTKFSEIDHPTNLQTARYGKLNKAVVLAGALLAIRNDEVKVCWQDIFPGDEFKRLDTIFEKQMVHKRGKRSFEFIINKDLINTYSTRDLQDTDICITDVVIAIYESSRDLG